MSSLLSPLLWSVLPSQITHQIIPYLNTYLPSLFPAEPRGSPGYIRNYRYAFTGVIFTYLAYTFFKSDEKGNTTEDFYALLGVEKDVDADGLKRAFRSLSRLYHPDRAGSGNDDLFIMIRRAYETLSDPVKRYAYDRFGPQILDWKSASIREYTITGLHRSIGFYIFSGGFMLLLSLLGRAKEGAYWRHTLFCGLLISEMTLILSPSSSLLSSSVTFRRIPSMFFRLFPILSSPQFIQIAFLHRLFTTFSIAINQLTSVWFPSPPSQEEEWGKVMSMLKNLEIEAVTGFQSEVAPLMSTGQPKYMEKLIQNNMEDILVERSMYAHPQIRQAQQDALLRPLSRDLRTQTPQHRAALQQLEIATKIPLPPSPPPSPRHHSLRLS
ncbi:uncharacterized protein IL334_001081 [Kwoniella shivajii]|uniref:J domain-containing protein n=1 Tax=Kwoniella shivajii TaxID=564305 RepID=A0ABZ1CV67_9TREE|nr:hypothetical protein IL334_001081 [Kwoniella shivajii]